MKARYLHTSSVVRATGSSAPERTRCRITARMVALRTAHAYVIVRLTLGASIPGRSIGKMCSCRTAKICPSIKTQSKRPPSASSAPHLPQVSVASGITNISENSPQASDSNCRAWLCSPSLYAPVFRSRLLRQPPKTALVSRSYRGLPGKVQEYLCGDRLVCLYL